jgi:hypothetical protein
MKLKGIGVVLAKKIDIILANAQTASNLPDKIPVNSQKVSFPTTVEQWLSGLHYYPKCFLTFYRDWIPLLLRCIFGSW